MSSSNSTVLTKIYPEIVILAKCIFTWHSQIIPRKLKKFTFLHVLVENLNTSCSFIGFKFRYTIIILIFFIVNKSLVNFYHAWAKNVLMFRRFKSRNRIVL